MINIPKNIGSKTTPRHLKPKKSLELSDSKLRNISLKSIRQTGRKAIFSHPVLSVEAQERYQAVKLGRRLNQATTSRALDILRVSEKEKRAKVHKITQNFINVEPNSKNTYLFIENIQKALGKKKGSEFLNLLNNGLSENSLKLNLKPFI